MIFCKLDVWPTGLFKESQDLENPTDLLFGLFVILDLNIGPSAADLYDTAATPSSVGKH